MKLKIVLLSVVIIGMIIIGIAYVLKGMTVSDDIHYVDNVSQSPLTIASPNPTQEIGQPDIVKPSPIIIASSLPPIVDQPHVNDTVIPKASQPVSGRMSTLRLRVFSEDGSSIDKAKVTLLLVSYDDKTHENNVKIIDTLDRSNDFWFGQDAYIFKGVKTATLNDDYHYEAFIEYNGRFSKIGGLMDGQVPGTAYDESWDRMPENITNNTVYGYMEGALNGTIIHIPGASVSLYRCTGYDGDKNVDLGLADVANNPQLSGDNGEFRFDGVPIGYYDVVAEKNGNIEHMIIDITGDGSNKYQVVYLFPYNWR